MRVQVNSILYFTIHTIHTYVFKLGIIYYFAIMIIILFYCIDMTY